MVEVAKTFAHAERNLIAGGSQCGHKKVEEIHVGYKTLCCEAGMVFAAVVQFVQWRVCCVSLLSIADVG